MASSREVEGIYEWEEEEEEREETVCAGQSEIKEKDEE